MEPGMFRLRRFLGSPRQLGEGRGPGSTPQQGQPRKSLREPQSWRPRPRTPDVALRCGRGARRCNRCRGGQASSTPESREMPLVRSEIRTSRGKLAHANDPYGASLRQTAVKFTQPKPEKLRIAQSSRSSQPCERGLCIGIKTCLDDLRHFIVIHPSRRHDKQSHPCQSPNDWQWRIWPGVQPLPHPTGSNRAVKWRSTSGCSTMRIPRNPARRSNTSQITSTT